MNAAAIWRRTFHLVDHRVVGGGAKIMGRDMTTWVGLVHGERFVLRISPRTCVAGESFLTSTNHRLRDSHVGRGGYFLDVEVLSGPAAGAAADELVALLVAVEHEDASRRTVRLRVRGAKFRSGLLADDVFGARE